MTVQFIPGTRYSYGGIKKIGNNPPEPKIGDFVSIGSGVKWISVGHNTDWVTTYPFPATVPVARFVKGHPKQYGQLVIENDVWIGNDVTFVGNVWVHNGATIGAGSVVFSRNLYPYSVSRGNPAQTVKWRFDDRRIQDLLKIAWWEWPEEKIMNNISLLCSENVDEFIKRHRVS